MSRRPQMFRVIRKSKSASRSPVETMDDDGDMDMDMPEKSMDMGGEDEIVMMESVGVEKSMKPAEQSRSDKLQCLIKTFYPKSIANILILLTLFLVFAFFIIPEELDEDTNELVPNWILSGILTVLVYIPISFSYHYVTNCMECDEE